jgi:hypothetical protein
MDKNLHAKLIRSAVLAPSSHNTQPWRFLLSASAIDLRADRTRALPVNDPDGRELAISCGCALMNLRAAAAGEGIHLHVQLLPDSQDPDWLARAFLTPELAPSAAESGLAAFIERRRTHRQRFAPRAVDQQAVDDLVAAANAEGASLLPILTGAARRKAAELVAEGDAAQWADPGWRSELADWMRSGRSGDGLTVPALATALARLTVRSFNLGGVLGRRDREIAKSSPLLAVLATPDDRPHDWLAAGQALQRLLLVASRHGIQASYLNQPIQVAPLRPRLQSLAGGGAPQIFLRLGYAAKALAPTPRRAPEEVMEWAA